MSSMPMYSTNDIIETQILVRSVSGVAMNQVYFKMKAGTPLPTTFADQIRNQYWTSYRLIISNQAEIFAVKSRRVEPGPPSLYVQEAVLTNQGSVIGSTQAEGLSHIIVLRTANGTGRTGRMFSPYPTSGAYLNGQMDPNEVGRLNNCVAGLNAAFKQGGTNGFLMQVVRKKSPAEGGQFFYEPVIEYQFRMFMGWQRSRVRGRGI